MNVNENGPGSQDGPGDTTLARLMREAEGPLIGTILITPGVEWVELCASAGFDFVCVDQMITSIDWAETGHMLRGAAAYGTSGWVRLPAYPWGDGLQDQVLPRDVLRALAVGADAVTASVDHPDDLRAMLSVQRDQHRKLWDGRAYDASSRPRPLPSIFPLIESLGALNRLDEFAAIDGVEAVFLGLGDLSRLLDVEADVEGTELQRVIRDAVELCRERSVSVMTTAGYRDTPEEVARAVGVLGDIGVGAVWIPYPTYVTYRFYQGVLERVRGAPART